MLPRLLDFGSFGVPTYGVMAAVGLVVALFVVTRLARREGINPEHAWNLGLVAILTAIVGAKVLLVINNWGFYSQNPRAIFSIATLQAGGVWYGGLLAALAGCFVYIRRHRMPVLRTCDVFAPGIAVGHAIGRLGCLAAGCCYGKPTALPWGVTFTDPIAYEYVGTPLFVALHPTQIYEFLVEMFNFGLLLWLFRRRSFDGQIMGAYMFLYGFARYFLEFFRDDPERGTLFGGMMSITQGISIALVIAGGLLWLRRPSAGRQTIPAATAR